MAMVVAAISFFLNLKELERKERRETEKEVYALPDLSLNPKSLNRGKKLRLLLEQLALSSK